jgi:hypothetical protein
MKGEGMALLVDTGSPDNMSGSEFVKALAQEASEHGRNMPRSRAMTPFSPSEAPDRDPKR